MVGWLVISLVASIDRIGDEGTVIRIAFVFALLLTSITSAFVVLLLTISG
jgi:lactate permease